MSCYIHDTPGRIRIKIPSIKGKEDRGRVALELLESLAGIENVSINLLTGSIVIKYDPTTTSAEAMLNVLSNSGFVSLEAAEKKNNVVDKNTAMASEALGK